MKLGSLLIQLQAVEHKMAVYADLIDYLGREGLEIPIESGIVPLSGLQAVIDELEERHRNLEECLEAAEELEIGDAGLKDLGGSSTAD